MQNAVDINQILAALILGASGILGGMANARFSNASARVGIAIVSTVILLVCLLILSVLQPNLLRSTLLFLFIVVSGIITMRGFVPERTRDELSQTNIYPLSVKWDFVILGGLMLFTATLSTTWVFSATATFFPIISKIISPIQITYLASVMPLLMGVFLIGLGFRQWRQLNFHGINRLTVILLICGILTITIGLLASTVTPTYLPGIQSTPSPSATTVIRSTATAIIYTFNGGFKEVHNVLGDRIGDPTNQEQNDSAGNHYQQTTKGTLIYISGTNSSYFSGRDINGLGRLYLFKQGRLIEVPSK